MCLMALSDAVLGNLATIYVGVIIVIKLYGLVSGTSFSAGFIFVVSVTAVGVLFGVALAWDVTRGAADAVSRYNRVSDLVLRILATVTVTTVVEFVKEGFAGTGLRSGHRLLRFGLVFHSTCLIVLICCKML
ncbi:unnamed protein product [Brassica napus]|uniref:Uncharacterized protein n=2 Tax=Brassica TaxID=3705 RepID=M4DH36_BRACM|nr:unnamed protein product [Brassica napus]